MLIWCSILFGLGVLAFLDTIFNYGEIFRRVNSVVFMLLSLGLLVRTRLLTKFGKFEELLKRNTELESQSSQSSQSPAPRKHEEKTEIVY
jgi:hypothetical protein